MHSNNILSIVHLWNFIVLLPGKHRWASNEPKEHIYIGIRQTIYFRYIWFWNLNLAYKFLEIKIPTWVTWVEMTKCDLTSSKQCQCIKRVVWDICAVICVLTTVEADTLCRQTAFKNITFNLFVRFWVCTCILLRSYDLLRSFGAIFTKSGFQQWVEIYKLDKYRQMVLRLGTRLRRSSVARRCTD